MEGDVRNMLSDVHVSNNPQVPSSASHTSGSSPSTNGVAGKIQMFGSSLSRTISVPSKKDDAPASMREHEALLARLLEYQVSLRIPSCKMLGYPGAPEPDTYRAS